MVPVEGVGARVYHNHSDVQGLQGIGGLFSGGLRFGRLGLSPSVGFTAQPCGRRIGFRIQGCRGSIN